MRRPLGLVLLLAPAAAAAPSPAQTPAPTPVPGFAERVEVNVRTIFAVVVDAKGRPISQTPGPGDIEVLEDGIPAQVLGVDPVRPLVAGSPSTAGAPAAPSAAAPTLSRAPAGPIQTLPQFLYVDTSLMRKQSVKQVAEAVEKNLDAILSRGSLEIVVADPDPKIFMSRTSDAAEIRRKLEELSRKVSGRERMLDIRRDLNPRVDSNGYAAGGQAAGIQGQARARAGMREEIAIVRQTLERLDRWAAANASGHPAIVYLAEDGFDANPGDFWTNLLQGNGSMEQMAQGNLIRNEVAGEIPKLVARSSKTLAESGFTAVMLALGRLDATLAEDASSGKRSGGQLRRPFDAPPTQTYVRPLEPLRVVADQTGGEVVTSAAALAPALDRLAAAVAITYRMDRPADGRPHKLEVRSRLPGVVLRASRSVVAGTSRLAAAGRAVEALSAPGAPGDIPLEATIDLLDVKTRDRRVGELRVSADLGAIASTLDRVGPGRLRVTVAVERSGFQPFVSSEEVDLAREGAGTTWLYNAPLEWPSDARRVSVRVEEQKTGTFGTATADLPSPGAPGAAAAAQASPAADPRGPELEIEATLSDVESRGSNQRSGMLRVVVSLEPIFDRLVRGGGNARVALRVYGDSAAGRATVATLDKTVPLDITVDRWAFELPIRWPASTSRLVVSFVERETGAHAERPLSPPPSP